MNANRSCTTPLSFFPRVFVCVFLLLAVDARQRVIAREIEYIQMFALRPAAGRISNDDERNGPRAANFPDCRAPGNAPRVTSGDFTKNLKASERSADIKSSDLQLNCLLPGVRGAPSIKGRGQAFFQLPDEDDQLS